MKNDKLVLGGHEFEKNTQCSAHPLYGDLFYADYSVCRNSDS